MSLDFRCGRGDRSAGGCWMEHRSRCWRNRSLRWCRAGVWCGGCSRARCWCRYRCRSASSGRCGRSSGTDFRNNDDPVFGCVGGRGGRGREGIIRVGDDQYITDVQETGIRQLGIVGDEQSQPYAELRGQPAQGIPRLYHVELPTVGRYSQRRRCRRFLCFLSARSSFADGNGPKPQAA